MMGVMGSDVAHECCRVIANRLSRTP
jgi:hypothetical protein